ncbi:MAG: electron transfer flavoprotein subunit beta/FixA family protein [Bacteroidales bacterium]|jgi:electron transfer flavoprotein beta subunit|nr:electron transfer flavoprotein subunit beta/FixA family protein [Bacteroidales bacterium]
MSFNILVLAKQVPDTRNVGKDAMKEDGTVNRGALPAVFNPDDLNALEMALELKSRIPNAEINVITMGPPRAAAIIRESMYRGANKGYLLTDARFAGSDTLATSYTLAKAVERCRPNIIFCGVQAIDGDTAQVGPQIAEKLQWSQITYAEELLWADSGKIRIKRRLERGVETVETALPVLVTVHASAAPCRSRNAGLLMKYKHARTASELQTDTRDYTQMYEKRPDLLIEEWNAETIHADLTCLGLNGSPTKVKKIENVVLTQKDSKLLSASDADVEQLVTELLESRIIG